MNHFKNWQYNWFGFWKPLKGKPKWPLMEDFLDPNWNPAERQAVLSYLDRAQVVVVAGMPSIKCGRCGEDIGNPSAYKSDGVWLWPADLAHNVQRHGIRLPDRMVEHMRMNRFTPPVEIKVEVPDLPWPP